jgi:hypothetical protein
MAHFEADHCEKKLASRRQEVPKKYSQMKFCNAYIYDALSHMLSLLLRMQKSAHYAEFDLQGSIYIDVFSLYVTRRKNEK